jgi:DNA-binding PadR family transcriptional regulator
MGKESTYQRDEILAAIIFKCLWEEPRHLDEILEKLENEFAVEADSLDGFLKCTSAVLGEAIKAGFIRRGQNLYALTPEGRKKAEVDQYSVFKAYPETDLI